MSIPDPLDICEMSRTHETRTKRGFTLTYPNSNKVRRFIPGKTTVSLDFHTNVYGGDQIKSCEFECLPTPEPQPILLTNPQLDYLHRAIANVRMAYLDCLADPNPNSKDQANLNETVQCLQGALRQHAAAAADHGKTDVELKDLFEVLKIEDQSEHEQMLEVLMSGLKL